MLPPNISVGDRALITTDAWFVAPDGRSYRAAFGRVRAVRSDQDTLGIRTNAKSTNWYLELGNLLIAGCQIHYAIRCDNCALGPTTDHRFEGGKSYTYTRPSDVYDAGDGE